MFRGRELTSSGKIVAKDFRKAFRTCTLVGKVGNLMVPLGEGACFSWIRYSHSSWYAIRTLCILFMTSLKCMFYFKSDMD